MDERLAMIGVPALAGVVTALVLLGPAQEHSARGVRVRGVVTRASEVWALRVETLRHVSGLYAPDPVQAVGLSLWLEGHEVSSWTGSSDADGLVEARLQLEEEHRGGERYELRVSGEYGVVTRTQIQLSGLLPEVEPLLRYRQEGNPSMELRLFRGRLAPPFPESAELHIHWLPPALDAGDGSERGKDERGDERPSAAPSVRLKPLGASIERGKLERLGCTNRGCDYRLPLIIRAQAPLVEMEMTVAVGEARNRWAGVLRVHSGALWPDPRELLEGRLRVRSAAPREQVFASLLAPSGRVWGKVIVMQPGGGGYAHGMVSLPPMALPSSAPQPLTLVLSGDAYEPQSSATWPLSNERPMVHSPGMSMLADSMPLARQREDERRARARRPAWGIVLAAGLFELFYLWRRNRLAQLKLAEHLRRQAGVDGERIDALRGARALSWLVVVSLALMAMFVVLAGVAAFG